MPVFVILLRNWTCFTDAAEAYGAVVPKKINSIFLRALRRVYSSRKLNRLCGLPFKGLCDWLYFDDSRINPDDDVYFIMYEHMGQGYSRRYLEHLRRKYPKCRLILFYVNPAVRHNAFLGQEWQRIGKYYDAGITVNKADAERLGMLFCDFWPQLLPDKTFQQENACDVFFAAAAKDRLPKILEVFEKLTDAGLKCEFYITGVKKQEQKYADVIHYTEWATCRWLDYGDILQKDVNAKCLLEIVPYGQNYATLRAYEAFRYHKKLLTTNVDAPGQWFYDARSVQVFGDAAEIDTEFVSRPLSHDDEEEIFSRFDVGDFARFAEWIISNVG